jgi:hypothetical protein
MENKYFTPALEDLHVGYECQYAQSHESTNNGITWTTNWIAYKITNSNFPYTLGALALDQIRTPFLTKEQIEDDEWTVKTTSWVGKTATFFDKGNYMMIFDPSDYHIEIIAKDVTAIGFMEYTPEHFRVTLPCKDINTLRFICKLLNIK